MKLLSLYPLPLISYTHDATAAVMSDERVIYAYEQERLTRRQHAIASFPEESALAALRFSGLTPSDFDEIVITSMDSCEERPTYREKVTYVRDLLLLSSEIPFTCVPHHLAHSALAVLTSRFEDCAFLTVDAGGDGSMGHWGTFDGKRFAIRETFNLSPGILYAYITCLAGFSMFEEGKVMGLAAYGTINDRLYTWLTDNFRIGDGLASMETSPELSLLWKSKLVPAKFDPDTPRRHKYYELGVRFHRDSDLAWLETISPWDIAATGQLVFEELMMQALQNVLSRSSSTSIAISGGAMQNVLLNDRLHRTLGANVHIPLAPHDAGLAVGAGLLRVFQKTEKRIGVDMNPFVGPAVTAAEVEDRINAFGFPYTEPKDLTIAAVEEIVSGKTIGWFSGRAEFGPRALGARSVLADPRNPEAKAKLNQRLKRRDWFMPYAPSILEERGSEFFEDFSPSPYMNRAFRVRPEKRSLIPSAIHRDGTCRAHSINAEANGRYYALVKNFEAKTGIPMVLNTSFNRHGTPIVATPDHALQHLANGSIECLAIERFLVYRHQPRKFSDSVLPEESCIALERIRFAARCISRGYIQSAVEEVDILGAQVEAISGGLKRRNKWIWQMGDDIDAIGCSDECRALIQELRGRSCDQPNL